MNRACLKSPYIDPNSNSRQSADNESGGNLSNLALKGIIGIQAMAQISEVAGQDSDASRYSV